MEIRAAGVGKQRILNAAEDLFTQRGYRAVSIREIAQACEVTNAALYYHFSSKEALFQEVLSQHAERLNSRLATAGQGQDPVRKRVEAILTEYNHVAAERRSPLFMLRREGGTFDKAQFAQLFQQMVHSVLEPLEEALQEAVESGELRALPEGYSPAALLVGMLHGLVQHRNACEKAKITGDDIHIVVDVFWRGLSHE